MPTTITAQNFDAVTAPALPTGWTYDTGYDTSTTVFTSTPNSLRATGTTAQICAYFNTQDANSGNVQTTATVSVSGTLSFAKVLCRGTVAPVGTTGTYYAASFKPNTGFRLFRCVAGVTAQVGSTIGTSATFALSTQYIMQIVANAGAQSGNVQRVSDGFWLNTSGVWQSGFVTAVTGADTLIPAANGYGGVAVTQGSTTDKAYFDNFLFESLGGGGTAWTQALPETLSVTDVRKSAVGKPAIESLTFTDLRSSTAARLFGESLAYSDVRAAQIARFLAESLPYTDVRAAGIGKAALETVLLTDTRASLSAYSRTLAEALPFTDTRSAQIARVFLETLAVTDTRAASVGKAALEPLTLTDTRSAAVMRAAFESLVYSDALTTQKNGLGVQWQSNLTETLSFADARKALQSRGLTETLTFTDSRAVQIARLFAESLVYTDARANASGKTQSLLETLALNDARQTASGRSQTLIETLLLNDVRAMAYAKAAVESLTYADVRAMAARHGLAETLALLDSLAGVLNPSITNTLRIAKPTRSVLFSPATRAVFVTSPTSCKFFGATKAILETETIMATLPGKAGDTYPITAQLVNGDGTYPDLSAAIVRCHINDRYTLVSVQDLLCTLVSGGTTGLVSFTVASGLVVGEYIVDFKATFSGGVLSYPNSANNNTFSVAPKLA